MRCNVKSYNDKSRGFFIFVESYKEHDKAAAADSYMITLFHAITLDEWG